VALQRVGRSGGGRPAASQQQRRRGRVFLFIFFRQVDDGPQQR
jgi:hypothetical protein